MSLAQSDSPPETPHTDHCCQLKTRATGSRGYKNQVHLRGLMKNQGF
jgi:hypothetical protein